MALKSPTRMAGSVQSGWASQSAVEQGVGLGALLVRDQAEVGVDHLQPAVVDLDGDPERAAGLEPAHAGRGGQARRRGARCSGTVERMASP